MAKKILINENEFEAFEGLSHLAVMIYIKAIRPYMDYKTGITGWKRGISYQSIKEEVYVEPIAGRHTNKSGSHTKSAIRNAIKELIKSGLLQLIPAGKKLVFSLVLAVSDNSDQNRNDIGTTQGNDTGTTQANAALLNELAELKQTMSDILKNSRNDTPPVSGKNNITTTTNYNLKTNTPSESQSQPLVSGGGDFVLIFDNKLTKAEKHRTLKAKQVISWRWLSDSKPVTLCLLLEYLYQTSEIKMSKKGLKQKSVI